MNEVDPRQSEEAGAGVQRRLPAWFWAVAGLVGAGVLVWLLRPVFAGKVAVHPVLLQLGPLSVRWYGVLIAGSFIPGYYLARPYAARLGVDADTLINFTVVVAVAGFVGARAGFVIQNLAYYGRHPLDALATWQGGLSIHGALVAGLLAAWLFSRRLPRRVGLWGMLDVAMPSVLLGQAIGRWGNFFNQELYGYPTNLPWKMYIAPEHRLPGYENVAFYHPTFLYESLWDAAGAAFLFWYRGRPFARRGDELWLYLVTYSVGRFWVEFFRMGGTMIAGLTLAQWVSLLLVAVGAAGWLWNRRRRQEPEGEPEEAAAVTGGGDPCAG
ncbi:MAG: prolipoprotein diacylglyceryl transferase [Firmicutes bacterium]|nr:prolipoprotein diacylglyceryl transferase [Bacillota bacterium]